MTQKTKRRSWEKTGHPWKNHNPSLFKSHSDPIKEYDTENFYKVVKKKLKKDSRGQRVMEV